MTGALPWKTAWVTGASTGIGRDIVLQLKAAGVKVDVIKGYDICRKGEGGPTCMTRPLVRG